MPWLATFVLFLVALATLLGAFFALRFVRAMVKASRPDPMSPGRFVRENRRAPGAKVVACIGASVTRGNVSFSWVELLAGRLEPRGVQLVNAGINGDLAWNALQRLKSVARCSPDLAVVLVGSNDVMASLSPAAEARYRKVKKLPVRPTIDLYRQCLEQIVRRLHAETPARVALCSLTVLGEDLDSEANQRIDAYNRVVRAVAEGEGATYLPVNERMKAVLEAARHTPGLRYDGRLWPMFRAIFRRYGKGMSYDAISAANGLLLTTECIHLNSRGAGIVAEEVEGFVNSVLGEGGTVGA